MSVSDLLNLFIQVLFILLTLVAVVDYLRHRDATRRDIALMISTLGITVGLPLIVRPFGITSTWPIGMLVLVAQPFLMIRLVQYFRTVSTRVYYAALVGMILLWIAVLLANEDSVRAILLAGIAYFVAIDGYAAFALIRSALTTAGVVRQRLRLIAIGSGVLALLLLLAGIAGLIPALAPITALLVQFLVLICVLAYYFGFAPPRWLRRHWQLTELHHYLLAALHQPHSTDISGVENLNRLSESAAQAVGGTAAGVARLENEQWSLYTSTNPDLLATALQEAQRVLASAWQNPQPTAVSIPDLPDATERDRLAGVGAETWLIVPIKVAEQTWGLLLVFLRRRSLFMDDDLNLLELLAQQSAIVLENYGLIQELRSYSEQLEHKVEARTAQLHESEKRYRQIVETAQEGIWVTDAEGKTTFVNPEMGQMLGYSVEELEERPLFSFLEEADQSLAYADLTARVQHHEFRFRRKNGETLWGLISATPLLNDGGEFIGALTMVTNITIRKQAEEEVRTLNTDLEQRVIDRTAQLAAANRELEAFSYSVSHDLRAPLRSIDGFSRILLEDYAEGLSSDAQRYLRIVREDAQQMGRLIDDLLTFSRLNRQDLAKQTVNPAALVEQVLADLRYEQKDRDVEVVMGTLPPCKADPALLKQVYVNLLSNALKFTRKREHTVVEVGCLDQNSEAVYYVKDNGVGFDMRYSNKLFGVFQRLHSFEEYEGTGVGLAIIQRVINRHGGRVWAEAEVDHGAAFYFTLNGASDHG